MSNPILSIKEDVSGSTPKAVANLLPCRIHHDGPVDPIDSYWTPTTAKDGTLTAYFRGRKLHGKTIPMPDQHRGVVMQRISNDTTATAPTEMDTEDIEESTLRHGAMQVTAEFDKIVVWGHEALAEATEDSHIRAMEEWMTLSEQIHSYPGQDGKTT